MNTSKKCSKCGQVKDASEFSVRADRPAGLYSCCKSCKNRSRSEQYRERRQKDPLNLWVVLAYGWSKSRAKTKGLPHALTHAEIDNALAAAHLKCCYCDTPFNFQRNIQTRADSPTLDRIIPSLGYIKENVVVCCYRCNQTKNDASPAELSRLAARVSDLVKTRNLES